jgi:hypothetical protein
MPALRFIYDETTNQAKRLGWWGNLTLEGARKKARSKWRYCLQGNTFYLPVDTTVLTGEHRICWGRIRHEEFMEYPWIGIARKFGVDPEALAYGEVEDLPPGFPFDVELEFDPLLEHRGFGTLYSARHVEEDGERRPTAAFISQGIIDAVAQNPDALEDLSKQDFERLMAELFARMGFDVDLYRLSHDEGIDFVAVRTDKGDPVIYAVQCKHPDKAPPGRRRRSLPVTTVREIYGVATHEYLDGAIAITSAAYTAEAQRFAEERADQIMVANEKDVRKWVQKYRWAPDE